MSQRLKEPRNITEELAAAYRAGRKSVEERTGEPNRYQVGTPHHRYFEDGAYDATVARADAHRRASVF